MGSAGGAVRGHTRYKMEELADNFQKLMFIIALFLIREILKLALHIPRTKYYLISSSKSQQIYKQGFQALFVSYVCGLHMRYKQRDL